MNKSNWFWDPLTLELTKDVHWDSGKRGVYWNSEDGILTIIDGMWTIKNHFKWNGTTGVPDGPNIDPPQPNIVPVISSKILVPKTWLASLIHDIGYIYMKEKGFPYTRNELDGYLRDLLEKVNFKYTNLYWWGVKKLGDLWYRMGTCFRKIF